MPTYIVSYDLLKQGQDYAGVDKVLDSYPTHWKMLTTTWIIVTPDTPQQIFDKVNVHLDANDRLFISTVVAPAIWKGFNDQGTAWLQKQLK